MRAAQPELILSSRPIDFELCELLGDKPADFLVVCLNGVPLNDFGTPYDTPQMRLDRQQLVDALNDRTDQSLWPKFWSSWKRSIQKQFGLPQRAIFRPVVSYKISRVCPGYSEHLHVAIRLFETLSDKIKFWSVDFNVWCRVAITSQSGAVFLRAGNRASRVIAEAFLDLLQVEKARALSQPPGQVSQTP